MYVVGAPRADLAGVVRAYGGYDEASARPVVRREGPTGSCTLILAWVGALDVDGDDVAPAFLAGMSQRAALTTFTGRQAGVQVDLTPLGLLRLIGPTADELAGRVVDVADLDGPTGRTLAALPTRLAEDRSWPARFARVDATLATLLGRSRVVADPEVRRAWTLLAHRRGRIPVTALATDVGWSRRHLSARFRRQIGLSPTAAGRVLRFAHATELLLAGGFAHSITTVAADAGYADHSHLVREFRALAGLAPGAWLAERVAGFPDVQDDAAGRS